MSGWQRHLRSAKRATEPSAGAVDRLRSRALAERPSGRRWPLAATGLVGVALAAGALLWLAPPPDRALAGAVLDEAGTLALTPDVRLDYDGLGSVDGTARAPRIRWESGRLHVEVTPERGIGLVVETRDARIEVVGTGFAVERSALGTTVEVDHGRVNVRCADGTLGSLQAGERLACLPTTAAAWVGRARALRAAGRPDPEVLEAVERGLALCREGSPEQGELLVLRLGVLIEAHRDAEALETADRYLATGATARLDEVRAIAEQLRPR